MDVQKFKVTEDAKQLTIEYKWFTYVAFFLVFFCIAWDSFLIFWYSTAGSIDDGAAWLMMVFPLAHVAVGVGLTYYTICLFINKTIITVNQDEIDIKHKPLPWRGQKKILNEKIAQLYVKEKISQGKNGSSRSYQLIAKLKGGGTTKVLDGAMTSTSEDMQFLERKIESFLEIEDYQVAGEYAGTHKPVLEKVARKDDTPLNPTAIKLINLEKGYFLNYNLKTWQVAYLTQYDWKDGQTDKLFQLINDENESMLLFLQKEMALVHAWVSQKISQEQFDLNKLDEVKYVAPAKITFEDSVFRKKDVVTGNYFTTTQRKATPVKQWFYKSDDQQQSMRILQISEDNWQAYHAKKANEYEFSNILPH